MSDTTTKCTASCTIVRESIDAPGIRHALDCECILPIGHAGLHEGDDPHDPEHRIMFDAHAVRERLKRPVEMSDENQSLEALSWRLHEITEIAGELTAIIQRMDNQRQLNERTIRDQQSELRQLRSRLMEV